MSDSTPLKRCSRCEQLLPMTSEFFIRDRNSTDGWRNPCRICKAKPVEPSQPKPPLLVSVSEKRCSTCQQVKSAADFYHTKYNRDHLTSQCKECILKSQKEKYNTKYGIIPVPEGYRRCSICQEVKPATLEFFHHHTRVKDGLRPDCRACRSADRKINPEKYQQAYLNRTEEQKERQKQTDQRCKERMKAKRHTLKMLALTGHEGEKRCPKCKRWYPATTQFFYPQKDKKSGLMSHCKACQAIYRVERKPRMQKWRRANLERGRQYASRRRALLLSIPGTHTATQITEQLKRQHYRCYYAACSHAKFKKERGKYVYHIEHTYPISRIVGMNIPGNDMSYIVLACPACNESKHDKFPWEWPEGGRLL